MREILVYDDYEIHKLGTGGGTQYEEVTTEKATRIDVTDVAKPKGKLIPFGRTEQTQFQGYNLFDYTQVNNLAYGSQDGITKILRNASYRGCYIPVTPGEHYFISRKNTTDFNRFRYCYTEIEPVPGRGIIENSQKTRDTYTSFDTVVPEGAGYLFLYLSNEGQDITPEMELQITKSEELLPYEPYVGGTASPSPEFPQPIENVEGRSCTNLFNKNTIETGYRIIWSSGLPYADETARASDYIEIKNDVNYSCNQKVYVIGYDQHKEYVGALTSQGFVKSTGLIYEHFTITDTSIKYIKVMGSGTSETTGGLFNINTFQLNEGSTALPYEEYFEGKRLELNVCNKNLVKGLRVGYYMGSTGEYNANANYSCSKFPIYVKSGSTYKFSKDGIGIKGYAYPYDKDNNYLGRVYFEANSYYTPSQDTYYFNYAFGDSLISQIPLDSNVQIEEGTTPTQYEEHKEQMIPFPLAEGQKLMEGDYLADDGVHHVRTKMTLNGTETWNQYTSIDTDNYYGYRVDAPANMKLPTNSTTLTNYVCDKFTEISWNGMLHIGNRPAFAIRFDNARIYIHAPFATIAELTEWLSNNNTTIEYDLTEEVVDPYTEAQQEAYNKLKNLKLYKGVNHIWTNTDGLEPNLQLTYKRVKQEGVLQVSNTQQLNNLEINNTEETPEELTPEIYEE